MLNAFLTRLLVLLVSAIAFAGCVDDDPTVDNADFVDAPTSVDALLADQEGTIFLPSLFTESIVDAAVDRTGDLYEPTIEVCDDGSIYITGHTILVDTTGAPVFGSHDDGATWAQLPWFEDESFNGRQVQGATPPVSDEIFLACGDDGWLYGSDITLASYPVNAWSGYGTEHSYWNFNAYDETKVVEQAECDETRFSFEDYETPEGVYAPPAPAKDRPWSAYAGGKLLLTSNPAGGPNQIGVLDVSDGFSNYYSLGHIPDGIEWNLCAGPGGSIPGVPDIRDDGLFAAPQRNGGALHVTLGHADDVMDVQIKEVFEFTTIGEITSVYGHALFDGDGDLFVGVTNNTRECRPVPDVRGEPTPSCSPHSGGFIISSSTDGGETFVQTNFTTEKPIVHWYMDANEEGPGALAVWAVRDNETGFDWFIGHVQIDDATGAPYLAAVSLAIDNGPAPSAHVTGAAVGPDGRAYLAMFNGDGSVQAPSYALSVYIQRGGPTLPVTSVDE